MKTNITTMLVVLLLALGSLSQGAIILDQSQTLDDGFAPLAYSPRSLGQTFRTNGGYLDEVRLLLGGSGDQNAPATISITLVTGGLPDMGNILWSQSYTDLGGVAGWFSVDTSASSLMLTSGQQYAIVLESTDPNTAQPNNTFLGQQYGDLYSNTNGALFENRGLGWVPVTAGGTPYEGADLAFETYVNTVPEPSTTALLGAIGILGLLRRSRK